MLKLNVTIEATNTKAFNHRWQKHGDEKIGAIDTHWLAVLSEQQTVDLMIKMGVENAHQGDAKTATGIVNRQLWNIGLGGFVFMEHRVDLYSKAVNELLAEWPMMSVNEFHISRPPEGNDMHVHFRVQGIIEWEQLKHLYDNPEAFYEMVITAPDKFSEQQEDAFAKEKEKAEKKAANADSKAEMTDVPS